MSDARTKLRELTDAVHANRNTVGAQAVLSLLNELERGCLVTMANGTKDVFDLYKGQYQMIQRLKIAIEIGPPKVNDNKEA